MDNVTVREATFSDYDGVMAISGDIYDGEDYLPRLYHVHLQDKNSNAYVVILNDTIAGFVNYYLMEEGKSCVKMALRVGQEYRGKGLSKILETEALKKTLEKHPGLETVTWTAVNHSATQKALRTDPSKVVHGALRVFSLRITDEDLSSVSMTTSHLVPMSNIRRLNLSETYKILSDPQIRKDLFPGKYFVAGYGSWTPYLSTFSNLRQVAMASYIAVSFSPNGNTCETFSFCTVYPLAPSGARFDLWCHGNKLNSDQVVTYLYFWLRHLPLLPSKMRISIGLIFPDHIDEKEIESHFFKDVCPIVSTQSIDYNEELLIIDQMIQK